MDPCFAIDLHFYLLLALHRYTKVPMTQEKPWRIWMVSIWWNVILSVSLAIRVDFGSFAVRRITLTFIFVFDHVVLYHHPPKAAAAALAKAELKAREDALADEKKKLGMTDWADAEPEFGDSRTL
jgi:hypothetical protein